jgi:ATP-dependent RNA helicase SUPV3L1/SUV3
LLHARGDEETMFMGSDTVAPAVRRLVPEAGVETRPRFSKLTYSGYRNIARLPGRSAIVAFSAGEVYAIAELIRRQKGGAAVVLGALSPRTRNAQVALYEAGEVDYIVATDAIGMGLNMDVNHVAFAGLSKFDGRRVRPLTTLEIAQIAGRAGRYMNDGTFGVTASTPPLDAQAVERLEAHEFEPLRQLFWRNSQLRFTSVADLRADLKRAPPSKGLVRPRAPEDERALERLAEDPDILALARGPKGVKLLWEVCQIPDYRKTMTDAHPRILGEIFRHLRGREGRLPADWVARHIRRLDRTEGDIETLTERIAGIRTWTYVSHRPNWLPDPGHWQEWSRSVEDKLSDALHEQLTLRFLDRRTSVLIKRLKDRDELTVAVARSGDVLVEGHYVGRLEGFHFAVDDTDNPRAAKAVNAAALKALRGEMANRVRTCCQERDSAFSLSEDGRVLWHEAPVARLRGGRDILHPTVETLPFDLLEAPHREDVRERLAEWFEDCKRQCLQPLLRAEQAELTGAARGLVFQLTQGLGSLPRRQALAQIEGLTQAERSTLRRLGIRFERTSVCFPALLKPAAVGLRALLWTVFHKPEVLPVRPPPGRVSLRVEPETPPTFYEAVGYRLCGSVAVRLDMLERIAAAAWDASKKGGFRLDATLTSLAGCTPPEMAEILSELSYAVEADEDGGFTARRRVRSRGKPEDRKTKGRGARGRCEKGPTVDPDSPFAKLRELNLKK